LLRTIKSVFHAKQYQGDTALTIPPFFKNARRGTERIWGEEIVSPQPMVINWPGLTDKEKTELMMTIAFITLKSSLVPLIEGLCAQI